jgi:hypothetical protein
MLRVPTGCSNDNQRSDVVTLAIVAYWPDMVLWLPRVFHR